MNNLLAYLGGFIVVVLAAMFAVPAMIDWNGYRGVFEEEASKALGRDVRVGGRVNLRLLPIPYVQFERVRLADVSGQTGEPFIRVENFTMRLSGPALLRGVIEATEIELTKPALTLALDGSGGGNWNTISLRSAALPFAPRDVTLRSVRLIDGAVSVYAPDATLVTRIEAINGELSADAIRGPFRFKGEARWSGAFREFRIATTELDASGGIRIKGSSRAPETGTTVSIDAAIQDFTSAPKLVGELTGRIIMPGTPEKPSGAWLDVSDSELPAMELKSSIKANADGAALSDMTLALENAAEPQLISGSASAAWIGAPRFDVALTSKWLDLDRLAGADKDSAPFHRFKQLVLGVVSAASGDGAASAKVDVEQIKIGGETVGGLKIDAERRDGLVRLKELRAGLPGGSRVGLLGELKHAEKTGLSFAGEASVSGTSLGRLKAWAEKSGAMIDVGTDGAFSADGKVQISGERFELTEASAEFGGRVMTGEVKLIDDGRRRAEITVESAELEAGDLFPETTKTLEAAILRGIGATAAQPDATPARPEENIDISLRVLAGQLKRDGEIYRDVDATVALENGNIRVPSAKFTTASGLVMSAEGRIDDKEGAPAGVIAFDASGASPASMRDLARVLGLENVMRLESADRIGSAKIAGLVRLGARSQKSVDVSLDGQISGSRLTAHAAFDDGLSEWRKQPSQVRLALQAPSVRSLAGALASSSKTGSSDARAVDLVMTTSGTLEKGAAVRLDIAGEGLTVGYEGTLGWKESAPINSTGRLKLVARDMTDALALVGIALASDFKSVSAQGVIDVRRESGEWSFVTERTTLGSSSLKGALKVAQAAEGAAAVTGNLEVDHIVLAGLLAPLVDGSEPAAPAGPPTSIEGLIEGDQRSSAWSNGRFNFSALNNLTADVALTFSRLSVGDGLQVRSGRLTLALAPGKLTLTNVSGSAAGGEVKGDISLQASPSGVAGQANLAFRDSDLSTLGAAGSGEANLDVKLAGQAQTPIALIASLSGGGKLSLRGARVSGPSHEAARSVVDAVFQGKVVNEPEPFAAALKDAFGSSLVELGSRTVDVKISNGVASIAPIDFESESGTTSATASLDINSWQVASLWKVAPRPTPTAPAGDWQQAMKPSQSRVLLPAASVALNGRLQDLGASVASIEATALQRDLAVRQVERRVEDLERLRREDEERVLLERERRRLEQEEKARAAAEARARRFGGPPPMPPQGPGATAPASPNSAPQTPPTAAEESPQSSAAPPTTSPPQPNAAPPQPTAGVPANAGAAPAAGAAPTFDTGAESTGAAASTATPDAQVPVPAEAGVAESEDQPAPIPRPRLRPRRSFTDESTRPMGAFP